MKCCAGSKLTVFILFLSIATLFGTEPGKQNVLNPANDQMCEIASLEMLSYSRCDLMGRVKTLELLLEALLEQLSTELPIYTPKRDTSSIEKKKNEFIRFGKRKNEFIRFGKRKNEFTRFGISTGQNVDQDDQHNEDKRKNEFIRFG